jgi:acetyltransferase-like isoleucine patch superfamily enzyme
MNLHTLLRDLCDILTDAGRRIILISLDLFPGRPGNNITEAFKRLMLLFLRVHLGPHCQVSEGFYVFKSGRVKFGRGCRIGSNFQIWNFAGFVAGDGLLASHNITVICGTHEVDEARTNICGPVNIGENVWIGANVLIVGPANLGDRSIIGANSFVTGNVPPDACYGGSPAKPLRIVSRSPIAQ